ncbi:MAG TPA: hypothetical protein VKT26_03370 [Acetobacteraceae bacterium]|nr:hypothetical protein [Acetobacteraceae bacterium]
MDPISGAAGRQVMAGAALAALSLSALAWLMRQPDALIVRYGRLCGHALGQAHCPACYVAATGVLAGLLLVAAALARRPAVLRLRA